ncbi:MAG: polymer-forming cytoskeletal protein [Bacteroidetes bacterium]|nr:MAG: polymer-forming cytoskeletal protein [Bacteroidota bacterium]REK00724.1 MAG: polymer-forming cytoskeletal protein [Bacteroidota bacterium]REK35154.1 MAG: polymer-forming cytoskeletal protein [Bacteroidota bacterium]REK48231.1 MAG: polymer-forming cytoskeletal protein [Bacteroidota bacterium]
MFSNKEKKSIVNGNKNSENTGTSINLIGAGTVIEGDVRSNGDIRIDGTVYGKIISKAKVVVGSTGVVEGDISCQNADVSGTVKGTTTVSELLFLKSNAKLIGDIVTGKLVVEVGATFTGSCNMGPVIKDIKHADKSGEISQEKTA